MKSYNTKETYHLHDGDRDLCKGHACISVIIGEFLKLYH